MNADWGTLVDAISTASQQVLDEGERPAPECRSQEAGKKTGQAALGPMQLAKDPLPSLALA